MREQQRALRVLARPGFSNRLANPYNWLLYTELSRLGVRVEEYGIGRSIVGRYDVCHVHWPESTFNASLIEALATTESLLCSLDALRAKGTRVVWTVHNLRAHERRYPRAEQAFFARFLRRVDGFIALSESGFELAREAFPALRARPGAVVPHPHYRSEYPDGVARSQARARLALEQDEHVLLFFGRVLEYKNVPELIRFVRALPELVSGKKLRLVVAGRAHDAQAERAIRRTAGSDPRIRLHLKHVAKDEAQLFFRASNLVVLPYREILNSGTALLSLSFDRPVMMPRRGAGSELERSVGSDWLSLYDELNRDGLERALARASMLPPVSDGRHLWPFEPRAVGAQTLRAYESVLGRANVAAHQRPDRVMVR